MLSEVTEGVRGEREAVQGPRMVSSGAARGGGISVMLLKKKYPDIPPEKRYEQPISTQKDA